MLRYRSPEQWRCRSSLSPSHLLGHAFSTRQRCHPQMPQSVCPSVVLFWWIRKLGCCGLLFGPAATTFGSRSVTPTGILSRALGADAPPHCRCDAKRHCTEPTPSSLHRRGSSRALVPAATTVPCRRDSSSCGLATQPTPCCWFSLVGNSVVGCAVLVDPEIGVLWAALWSSSHYFWQ
ncbi:hypothetical protein ZIOFF_062244 [Zingiber officinale]|uniref:Uncharacterized protein n=1 Tax=Zingiber officinale TaxID=94328 RepID=A0A8J5F1K0_ZINOF|nr:hypothetical protein ZIOFF_062244 [Zingiber officinale]